MMEKFTKGPWLWGGASVVLEGEGMPLCCLVNSAVNTGDNSEDYANAALIAAAPEMYDLLEKISIAMECFHGVDTDEINKLLAKADQCPDTSLYL